MSEVTITPGQIAEMDKKLRRAGIQNHDALQRILDDKERFAEFVELLNANPQNILAKDSFRETWLFVERITRMTREGRLQWEADREDADPITYNDRISATLGDFSLSIQGFGYCIDIYDHTLTIKREGEQISIKESEPFFLTSKIFSWQPIKKLHDSAKRNAEFNRQTRINSFVTRVLEATPE